MPRPPKNTTAPPPLYLSNPSTPYCHTCGRIISSHASGKRQALEQEQKYCSVRCRREKPGELDREIEGVFVRLLDGSKADGSNLGAVEGLDSAKGKARKGDGRVVVRCGVVEEMVFGPRRAGGDVEDADDDGCRGEEFGRLGPVARVAGCGSVGLVTSHGDGERSKASEHGVWGKSRGFSDLTSSDSTRLAGYGAGDVELQHTGSELQSNELEDAGAVVNTPEMTRRRLRGQRIAQEREMVRRAARRGAVFGFLVDDNDEGRHIDSAEIAKEPLKHDTRHDGDNAVQGIEPRRRKCEAVLNGIVVEPSFAKGDWGIRWRV